MSYQESFWSKYDMQIVFIGVLIGLVISIFVIGDWMINHPNQISVVPVIIKAHTIYLVGHK